MVRPSSRPFLLLPLGLLLAGCMGLPMPPGQDKVVDEATRVQYYEEAAKTYYDGGRYQQAVAMWEKVLAARPEDPWAKFGLAKSLQMMGTVPTLRRAQNILEPIVNQEWVHPTRGNVRFEVQATLATVYSDLADYYDRDMRSLEVRLKKDPNADGGTLQEQIQRQKTVRDQLLTSSLPLWQSVLCQSPDNPYALAGLSKANLLAGSEEAGIDYGDRYVELSKRSQEGWRRKLAEWQNMKKGEMTPEERAFYTSKIQGAREKEMGMLLLLGSVHMRREEFQRAVARYDAVLDMDPAAVAALVERAQAYAGMGLYEPAIRDLEQYLKLTDATRQREARISAAELLDRYRAIVARSSAPGTAGASPLAPSPAPPAPVRSLPPAAPPPGSGSGSPDG